MDSNAIVFWKFINLQCIYYDAVQALPCFQKEQKLGSGCCWLQLKSFLCHIIWCRYLFVQFLITTLSSGVVVMESSTVPIRVMKRLPPGPKRGPTVLPAEEVLAGTWAFMHSCFKQAHCLLRLLQLDHHPCWITWGKQNPADFQNTNSWMQMTFLNQEKKEKAQTKPATLLLLSACLPMLPPRSGRARLSASHKWVKKCNWGMFLGHLGQVMRRWGVPTGDGHPLEP